MDDRSDEDLLVGIAAGPGALSEFYRRHVTRIMAFGTRRLDDPEAVADFVAEVFLEVMESAATFDPRRGRALAWLYGLAANVAARERRRQVRAVETTRRLSGRQLLDGDDYERIEEQIDADAQARAVYAAMARLSHGDRRLLELIAVDGLPPAQVAALLNVSPVAFRVRLTRARRRLHHVLASTVDSPAAPASRKGASA